MRQTNGDVNPFTTSFYNPDAFAIPDPSTFGNEPRSLASARTYGSKNENFTFGKKINIIGERATIDFRAEFFNIFNRHILTAPSGGRASNQQSIPGGGQ